MSTTGALIVTTTGNTGVGLDVQLNIGVEPDTELLDSVQSDPELVYIGDTFGDAAVDELITRISLGEDPTAVVSSFQAEMDELDLLFEDKEGDTTEVPSLHLSLLSAA